MKRTTIEIFTVFLSFFSFCTFAQNVEPEADFKVVVEDVAEDASLPPAMSEDESTEEEAIEEIVSAKETIVQEEILKSAEPETVKSEPVKSEVADEPVKPYAICSHSLKPPMGFNNEVMLLQLFLDKENFSAGPIDGVWGKTTQEAMIAWQKANNQPATTWIPPDLYVKLATMKWALMRYTITEEDLKKVTGVLPTTWSERSKMDFLGFATLGDCLAEKFHTSQRALLKINSEIESFDSLMAGSVILVPDVLKTNVKSAEKIEINLDTFRLSVFDKNGTCIAWFPCSIAKRKSHVPENRIMEITAMAESPNYTYDPATFGHDRSIGKMIINPGPRNPVGTRWLSLSQAGYGIHGTANPQTIGRAESRGCFRLTNWNIEKLFKMVRPGIKVEIISAK